MRAWDEGDEILRERAERRAAEDAERRAELQARGIDLDPTAHDHDDHAADDEPEAQHGHHEHPHGEAEPHDHQHGHTHAEPGERPIVGVVGAGAVGLALVVALDRDRRPAERLEGPVEVRKRDELSLIHI